MSKIRRVIHRLDTTEGQHFDELRWPINLALFLLAALATALVVFAGGWNEPKLLHNGWARLTTLSATLGLLAWAVNTRSPQRARRLQLAVLISLIAHILLAILLNQLFLTFVFEPEEPTEAMTRPKVVAMPVPVPLPENKLKKEFERPVKTDPIEPVKQQVVEKKTPVKTPENPLNLLKQLVKTLTSKNPAATNRNSPASTRPKRSDELSKLAKSTAAQASTTGGAKSPEKNTPETPKTKTALHPTRTKVERWATKQPKRTQPNKPKQPKPSQTVSPSKTIAPPRSRRASTKPTPSKSETKLAKRQAKQEPTKSQIAKADSNRKKKTEQTKRLSAATTKQTRRRAELPKQNTKASSQDALVAKPSETPNRPRLTKSQPQPTIAQSDERARNHKRVEIAKASNSVAKAAKPSTSVAHSGELKASTEASGLQRSAQQTLAKVSKAKSDDSSETMQPVTNQGQQSTRSKQLANAPSLSPMAPSTKSPRRTLNIARTEASPAESEPATIAANSNASRTGPSPSALALTRSTSGFVGSANSPNAGNDSPASSEHFAPSASVAARRPSAQQEQNGPALSPAMNARLAKATAGADAPSAPALAKPTETAAMAGTERTGKLAASSSASSERRFASAPLSDITASTGSNSLDTGTEQIVAAKGTGRAAGGGQPTLQLSSAAPTRRSSSGGGAPAAAISAKAIAAMPSAPSDTGGGSPKPSSRLAASKTDGADRSSTASVVAAPSQGSESQSLAIGDVGPTTAPKRMSAKAEPGNISGGGSLAKQNRTGRSATISTTAIQPESGGSIASTSASDVPGSKLGTLTNSSNTGDIGRSSSGAVSTSIASNNSTSEFSPDAALAGEHVSQRMESETTAGGVALASGTTPSRSQTASADIGATAIATPSTGAPTVATSGSSANGQLSTGRIAGPGKLSVARQGNASSIDLTGVGSEQAGLGPTLAVSAGIQDRIAKRSSEVTLTTTSRFVKKKIAGTPTIQGAARKPAPAFASRAKRGMSSDPSSPAQPNEKTEASIELGLKFLAKQQLPDGRWSLAHNGVDLKRAPRERPRMRSDAAATGLALLAFLGAGYDHFDDKYQDNVKAAIKYLVENQQPTGELYIKGDEASAKYSRFYSHGIATIALCEAYGMTGDKTLKAPAQKAINFIVQTQHPKLGGWRYNPGRDSDLSVTGWQVMALKSGELAGLKVPHQAYEQAQKFVNRCRGPGGDASRFLYNPQADANNSKLSHGRKPSTVMTSVGLLTNLYLGKDRSHPDMQRGAKLLLQNKPSYNTSGERANIGTMTNPWRDTYYWYYGTQVMFHMKGEYWKEWNSVLHPTLLQTQTPNGPLAGSWNPYHGMPDQWAELGGRFYVTTMNLLSLEVYYRHLPLFEETGK